MSLFIAMCAVCARHYAGHLLGVSVHVKLDVQSRSAHVSLRGAPMLGHVHGIASFGEDGTIHLDEGLRLGLSRRGCTIIDVTEHGDFAAIDVCVRLPIFGIRNVSLFRNFHEDL